MALPASPANGVVYGGDFRIGARNPSPAFISVGDSRTYGLKGDLTHTFLDYMTLHQLGGVTMQKINRGWPSLTAKRAISDPLSAVDGAEQINNALSFWGSGNILMVGPIGVNDLAGGDSIANILTYNETLCKLHQSLGNKVIFCSEVSAGTTVAGVTGDMLKNQMRAWALAVDTSGPNTGNPHWMGMADAYVDPGGFPPMGQDGSGTYGPTGHGFRNSLNYDVDVVHWNDGGHHTMATNIQPVANALIDALNTAGFVKPNLPSFLDLVAQMKDVQARLTAGGL